MVDLSPACRLVSRPEVFPRAEAPDRPVVVAEAPGAHADPAEVLHRVAEVRELPVEDCANALGSEDDVSDAIVAVHESRFGGRREVLAQPTKRQLESGMGLRRNRPVGGLEPVDFGLGR